MPARVAILGIYHETNTFIRDVLLLKDFNCARGGDIRKLFADAHHEIGGVYEVFDREGIEVVEILFADATPGGKISDETYLILLNELLSGLKQNLPLDGCMLIGHGAAVSVSIDDLDGHWFGCVRALVGNDVPLVATLDPHANVSPQMVNATNALFAYKTNPHIDQRDTGKAAAMLMVDILNGKRMPVQYLVQLPLAISIEQQCTGLEPCRSLYAWVQRIYDVPDILYVNIFLGFLYADVAEMGSAAVVVADRKMEVAYELGKKIENKIRQELGAYNGMKITATDAIERIATAVKPVLLLDMGDNIGGGAPGNNTVLLRLLNEDKRYRFFICIYDPEVVKEAGRQVPGSSFVVTINEYPDAADNYTCEVKLIRTADGKFREDKPVHGGKRQFDMGSIAIVKTTGNGIVLFTSLRMPPFSLRQLTSFGIHPHDFDVVVAKGVNAPLAAYREACPSVVQADTPGVTQADATRFTYQKRRRPMYPFESIEECNAAIT